MVISVKQAVDIASVAPLVQELEKLIDARVRGWLVRQGPRAKDLIVVSGDALSGKAQEERDLALDVIRTMYLEAGWSVFIESGGDIHLYLLEEAQQDETPPDGSVDVVVSEEVGGGGIY